MSASVIDPYSLTVDVERGELIAGRYRIVERVGGGDTKEVFRALDEREGRTVALGIARDTSPKRIAAIMRYSRAQALPPHPGLVAVHGYGATDAGLPFVVMEHVNGPSVGHAVMQRGRMTLPGFLRFADELLSAVGYLHRHDLTHAAPHIFNVLLSPSGVKLADLDWLRSDEDRVPHRTDYWIPWLGHAHQVTPEMLAGLETDRRTDLYTVGLTLHFAAVGFLPWQTAKDHNGADVFHRMTQLPPPPSRVVERFPPELKPQWDIIDGVLLGLLTPDREHRTQSADEARKPLRVLAEAIGTRLDDETPKEEP